jgi:hypothetical protein
MENTWNQSETLFAFCGWLTTRKEITKMGSSENASPTVERITEFMKRYNLPEVRKHWEDQIIPE